MNRRLSVLVCLLSLPAAAQAFVAVPPECAEHRVSEAVKRSAQDPSALDQLKASCLPPAAPSPAPAATAAPGAARVPSLVTVQDLLRSYSVADTVATTVEPEKTQNPEAAKEVKSAFESKREEAAALAPPSLSGRLVTGAAFLDVGESAKTDGAGTPTQLAYIAIESARMPMRNRGARPGALNAQLIGRLGFEPSLVMVAPEAAEANADPAFLPKYQKGLLFTLGARLNHSTKDLELGAFMSGGITSVMDDSVVVEPKPGNGQAFLAVPVDGGTGRTKWRGEVGVRGALFSGDHKSARRAMGREVAPLELVAGLRSDARFMSKELKEGYESAGRRFFVSASFNALQVFSDLQNKPLGLSFSVEHEGALGQKGIPSGTRVMIRGDVDLLKMLSGETAVSGNKESKP